MIKKIFYLYDIFANKMERINFLIKVLEIESSYFDVNCLSMAFFKDCPIMFKKSNIALAENAANNEFLKK